ncbi:hypothetical protein [Raoultella sp. C349492]|uniref:hypothetical protein n=1 Tax=Raoultella sp. C349492 TaxID=2970253 RepID=UPI0035C6DDD5
MTVKLVLTIEEDESGISCQIQGDGFCTKREKALVESVNNAIVECVKTHSVNPSEVKVLKNEQRGNKNVH